MPMDLVETNANYIFKSGSKALYCDRLTGKLSIKDAAKIYKEWSPVCLGKVDGIIGKLRYYPDSCWRILFIRDSEHVGYLPDGSEIRRVLQFSTLALDTNCPGDLNLNVCDLDHSDIEKRAPKAPDTTNCQKQLISQVPKLFRTTAFTVDAKQFHQTQREKYERRIHEELIRLLNLEEGNFFYFCPNGGDATSWTQRKYSPNYYTGVNANEVDDASTLLKPTWRQPAWRRADPKFFWNSNLLSEVIAEADQLLSSQGFPAYGTQPTSSFHAESFREVLSDLEGLIMPIVQGYVETERISLRNSDSVNSKPSTVCADLRAESKQPVSMSSSVPLTPENLSGPNSSVTTHNISMFVLDPDNIQTKQENMSSVFSSCYRDHSSLKTLSELSPEEKNSAVKVNATQVRTSQCCSSTDITIILFSRRSRYRAGTRYRRRGIDPDGHVANYVETEQILQTHMADHPHVVAFLQARGSVPLYWSQTGLKYRPPINLEKDDADNQAAFARHWNQLSDFEQLFIVSLLDTGRKRAENRLSEAYVHHLMLYNKEKFTVILFDFHDYCRGLRFENASILLANMMDTLRDMKFCWVVQDELICRQRWIFRVNCLDCLDRTNLVQCMFAGVMMATQLKKFGLLGPEDGLPSPIMHTTQRMWANNGDAISHQYAGTAAMKGDFTRTGERTMNGMMRDGVSSVNRYYLRFREIVRQAAIDLLLGNEDSPELILIRSGAGVESASMQAREECIKKLLRRCRSMLLSPKETPLSECLLTVYSELISDPVQVNTILVVSDQYLHFIRIDLPLHSRRPVYVRIPVNAIQKLELGLEPSVFRARRHVLRIFYAPPDSVGGDAVEQKSPPKSDDQASNIVRAVNPKSRPNLVLPSNECARSKTGSVSDSDVCDVVQLTHTEHCPSSGVDSNHTGDECSRVLESKVVTERHKPPRSTLPGQEKVGPFSKLTPPAQYCMVFTQPDVRLFNTVLVPVPVGEEAMQALQVVASMILVGVGSQGRGLDLQEPSPRNKLQRIRQAPIPTAYQPSWNPEQFFAKINFSTWYRDPRPWARRRPTSKPPTLADLSGSPDKYDDMNEAANYSTINAPSRMDRFKERFSQLKLPDIRLRLANRSAAPTEPPSIQEHMQSALPAKSATSDLPFAPTKSQRTSGTFLNELSRLVQRPLWPDGGTPSTPQTGEEVPLTCTHQPPNPNRGSDDSDARASEDGSTSDISDYEFGDADDEADREMPFRIPARNFDPSSHDRSQTSHSRDNRRSSILNSISNFRDDSVISNRVGSLATIAEKRWSLPSLDQRIQVEPQSSSNELMYARASAVVDRTVVLEILKERMSQSENNLDKPLPRLSFKRTKQFTSEQILNFTVPQQGEHVDLEAENPPFNSENKQNADEFSLVRPEDLPDIAVENAKTTERLKKKQLAAMVRLDEIRKETCPDKPIRTSFIIF
ncbi:unnamed protein product [Calicophoron daubneyi]|uniref:SAC domain-containing protein n=1 Tax=Calicophoron daubneyi TaxID=300641 RepID=A0AAV2TGH3_CALDB